MTKPVRKSYTHLFFDLDHTLWDFDSNARETLYELYEVYRLRELGIVSPDTFIETYTANNHQLWKDYHNGIISKIQLRRTRFRKTFMEMGLKEEDIPQNFEDDYVRICPTKTNLFPHVHETLSYLREKRYKLFIITNGFQISSEIKMSNTGLRDYFDNVFVSEILGISKPDKSIFKHALATAGTTRHKSLMIGDSLEADIVGAANAGMDTVFFNPFKSDHNHNPTYEIAQLNELRMFL